MDEWIEGWVERFGDKLVQYATIYTGDADLAQDIAQDTFLALYRASRQHPEAVFHPGWLFRVAHNLIRSYGRRGLLRSYHDPGALSQVPDPHDSYHRILVHDTFRRLPPRDQECLAMFYYFDCTVEEMSQMLSIAPASVRGRLFRARRRFEAIWRDDA